MKKSINSTLYASPSLNIQLDKIEKMMPLETSDFVSRVSSHSQFGIETLPADRTFTIKKNGENLQQTGSGEYILTSELGGDLGEMIRKYSGLELNCMGSLTEHREVVTTWYGYLHNGGLADKRGRRWWAYVKCSLSGYCTAWWKVERLIRSTQRIELIERQQRHFTSPRPSFGTPLMRSHEEKSCYQVLGVKPTATTEEIERAYKNLVKRYHPDVSVIDAGYASELMKEINGAYEILSNPGKRAIYDDSLRSRSLLSPVPKHYRSG